MLTLLISAFAALAWLLDITLAPEGGTLAKVAYQAALVLSAVAGARILQGLFAELARGRGASLAATDRVRAMLSLLIYAGAGLAWLRYGLGVDVSGLLATSAVVSVILGFALQATLGNLFSGLSLEMERPLQVGDYIQKGQTEGLVEALKWRSLFIRTDRNTRIVLPNSALTNDAVEVYRKDAPSRHMVTFNVAAEIPPMEVLGAAMEVLTSGLPDICRDPAPSAVLLGVEPYTGALRYGARFYTLAYLDRSTIGSGVYVRLWYALSRRGIALNAPPQGLILAEDGGPIAPPAPHALADPETPPTSASDLEARMRVLGRRLRFGPGERIELGGGAAMVLAGSAREEVRDGENDVAGALAWVLATPPDTDAAPIISGRLLTEIADRAAGFIGPIAHALAARYGARTDDPFMLYRTLAEHIAEPRARSAFLSTSPPYPSRRLVPGALFGWAAVLGLEPADMRHPVSNSSVEILLIAPDQVKAVLANLPAVAARLAAGEPGLHGLSDDQLAARLALWPSTPRP